MKDERVHELLDRYAECRRLEALEGGPTEGERAETARRTVDELRSLWAAQGEDPAALDKLLHQADFRERVLALYGGRAANSVTQEYERAREEQKALTVELREFWLSSGHELEELRQFESEVDAQVYDMIVK